MPPLIMKTLGNPHHSLLLGNPHHGLLGDLHHTWEIPVILGNPQHGLLGNLHHGGIPVTVFSWRIPIILENPHHCLLLPPFGRWWISFFRISWLSCFSFPSIIEIILFLLLWTCLKRFPSRSDSPVIFRMGRLATPFSILSTSLKGSQIRPLRGRNWRRIPTSMRSMLETHSLLTWSVMAFIRKLHDRNLLPKDDQIISQLQKSFSKAYGNLAFGLSSSAVFVTLKRRQLPLSRMVPSVSDVLMWILISDHLISPRGGDSPPTSNA